jgi:ferrous iron transport protein A
MSDKREVTLSKVEAGATVIFKDVTVGNELRTRLAAMGMVARAEITVISNSPRGPFMVNIKGSKIALGKKMAEKIIVIEK